MYIYLKYKFYENIFPGTDTSWIDLEGFPRRENGEFATIYQRIFHEMHVLSQLFFFFAVFDLFFFF